MSYGARATPVAARSPPVAGTGVLLAGVLAMLALSLLAGFAGLESTPGAPGAGRLTGAGSPADVPGIPPAYLRLYVAAGRMFGIDWAVLAGIGKLECDHGRDPDASCTREGAVNTAGAGGPMQFLASTWAAYGVDGDRDGRVDRWDPADAVPGAANYLSASGVRSDPRRAVYAYNHSNAYVDSVLAWARRYAAASRSTALEPLPAASPDSAALPDAAVSPGLGWLAPRTATSVTAVAGSRARLADGDGHLALIPVQAPPVVQAMLVAGNELQDLPYGPDGHPDPRAATQEDCSSTLNYVLYRSGVRPIGEVVRENPLAQDYVTWGAPGPGRWVTIYATRSPTPHVFVVIAGLRLDTSHDGTDVGPNRTQDGPRWRVLDRIPTWARWVVRHPPGL